MQGSIFRLMAANAAVVAIAMVAYMQGGAVAAVSPFSGMVTDLRSPTFEWSGPAGAYEVLIDDDPGFGSPMSFSASGNSMRLPQELEFGTYWWKVRSGSSETGPSVLTVVSSVALSRPAPGTIVNAGNTDLLLFRSGMTGAFTLAVNRTMDIGGEESVKAEQG